MPSRRIPFHMKKLLIGHICSSQWNYVSLQLLPCTSSSLFFVPFNTSRRQFGMLANSVLVSKPFQAKDKLNASIRIIFLQWLVFRQSSDRNQYLLHMKLNLITPRLLNEKSWAAPVLILSTSATWVGLENNGKRW